MRARSFIASVAAGVAAAAVVALLWLAPAAWAADRWIDITDQEWVDSYGITAVEAATVADGYQDGSFAPYQAVTRAQFAKMAVKGLGLEVIAPATPTFSDVGPTHSLYLYVESARVAGIIGGYQDGSFRPDALITRQQANTMLGRFLSQRELEAVGVIWGPRLYYPTLEAWSRAEGMFYLGVFSDLAGLDAAHRPGSGYLVYHDVVRGSGSGTDLRLEPGASLSRAQAVTVVLRTLAAVDSVAPGAPPAPRNVATFPGTPSAGQRPCVSGQAVPGGRVILYDTFAGSIHLLGQVLADSVTGDFSIRVPEEEALAEGVHSFTLRVRNTKGLLSDYSAPVSYEVDGTAPVAFVTTPADGAFSSTGSPSFAASASDSGSGVQEVRFEYAEASETPAFQPISIGYSAPYAATWGVLRLPEGRYLLRATAVDRAGNAALSQSVLVSVDVTPPVAGIVLPEPAAPGLPSLVGTGSPLFTAVATDPASTAGVSSGVAGVRFCYAPSASLPQDPTVGSFAGLSTDAVAEGGVYQAEWGLLHLPDGAYGIAAYAVDGAGNLSPLARREVAVDTAAPEVEVLRPQAGEELPGGLFYQITWQAVDPHLSTGCVTVLFSGDDGLTWSTLASSMDNTGFLDWTPDAGAVLDQCRLRVEVIDRLGHVGSAVTGRFTILGAPGPEAASW